MTHDYSEELAPAWTGIDSRRVLSTGDVELITEARAAHLALGEMLAGLPSAVHLMRDAEAGHPRAAAADRSGGGQAPWCWEHERTTKQCEALGLLCEGEVIDGPSDPTGSTAVGWDPVGAKATSDLRVTRRALAQVSSSVQQLAAAVADYPTVAEVDEEKVAGPGPGNCRLCWLDGQRIKTIETTASGKRRYKDLCRRCGQWRHRLGGDPPQWFINRLNRGDHITEGIEARAKQEVRSRLSKKRGKPKPKAKAQAKWERPDEPSPVDRGALVEDLRASRRARSGGTSAVAP